MNAAKGSFPSPLNIIKKSKNMNIIRMSPYPFPSQRAHMASLSKTFDFNFRRDHQKNFL